ncbi:DUF4133 domain-containing protein [Pedobacter aquatilis]|uniref:DUF4133 domain-containing protein n=1 Tax=Pedobacter aquatilis TaxID=351343 RepID=UPI00292FFF3A|nr:DUF4133 domain-containing protein [Pedobacter aquatilis]
MAKSFSVYKGLQKPLVYRGFKGKFIFWAIASLAVGLVAGGLVGALINMYLGGLFTIISIIAGLSITFQSQKGGLHAKSISKGLIVHPIKLKIHYEKGKKEGV